MKKICFLLMFTCSITTLFAQSQSEMNNDAFISYKKVDNELGIVYQLILKNVFKKYRVY